MMAEGGWRLAIDFGTSFTTAAMTRPGDPAGQPVVLEVENSRYLPSAVFRDESGELLTGKAALRQAMVFPERAERVPKRALVAGDQVILGGTPVPVTDLVAALLRRMLAEAARHQDGQAPESVVLTHPARWGEALLSKLREAAGKAGIDDPVLVSEPVAAAWHYARPVADGAVGIFDLGGGTLDTAILRAQGGGYEVAGPPGGDPDLGGEDFDDLLLGWVSGLAQERDEAEWKTLFEGGSARSRRDLALVRQDVITAKEALSEVLTYDLAVVGFDQPFRLTRTEFDKLIGASVDGAAAELARTITAAGMNQDTLTTVFLTGGSSRIPLIAARLAARLGIQPQLRDDPKTAVALGALVAVLAPIWDHDGWRVSAAQPAGKNLAVMFRGGPARAGTCQLGYRPVAWESWVRETGPGPSSPVVADGRVYVASGDGYLHARRTKNGKRVRLAGVKWRVPIGAGTPGVVAAPLVSGDVIYAGGTDGALYAISGVTGEELGRFQADGGIDSSPAIADGLIYFGDTGGWLHAIDALTGAEAWRFQTHDEIHSSPAVANGLAYVGSDDGRLYAVGATDGTQRWAHDTGGRVRTTPAVSRGVVYYGSDSEALYARNAETGSEVWKYEADDCIRSSPAVADRVVYAGVYDGTVVALDAKTGKVIWEQDIGDDIWSSPTVTTWDGKASTVYIGSDDKSLHALDADDGEERWAYDADDWIHSTPAVVDGTVYFTDDDCYLHAVDAEDGD